MKYTKLFNQHNDYVAYTASTSFIRPNVSWCILEKEPHCTPALEPCEEQHIYEIMGEPSYPSTVPASATSFDLSFTYSDTYTARTCEQGSFIDGDTVTIPIEENPSISARTISGAYVFHDISIPYSFTQEGREELPYNQQYLTFEILTGGTILWKAATNAVTRTISYSINDGEWTEITSTTEGVEINVSANDKVRFKGTNTAYATAKDTVSTFSGSTASFDVYGNAMSLIGGDDFSGLTSFTTNWAFHDLFNTTNVVSAKNLILPVTTLRSCCYRAMFAHAKQLVEAPELPATTLASSGYCYMFQDCTALQKAPDLLAENIVDNCYTGMFNSASTLNYIKCTATSGIATGNTKDWTKSVAASGTFIKSSSATGWTTGANGIPTNWVVYNDTNVEVPIITFNGFETITLSCETEGADILYKLNNIGEYSVYTAPIIINEDTFIEVYSEYEGETSRTTSQTCQYVSSVPIEYSNRDLKKWQYGGQEITTPYSVNAIDGHSSSYAKGTFNFETSFALSGAQPTYLWFQHADQSASIYVDNTLAEKHWGGYAAFTSDISEYVHGGINNIKVAIKNNEGNNLAPASADFNFNATLGNVRLLTSPCLPAMNYGYDGFHITSTVSDAEATMYIKTSVPTGATLVCKIDDGNTNIYSATSASTGAEMTFTKVISNPHLWNGKSDPYMYTVTLEIYGGNDLYHRFVRPYGLRYYEYVINDTEKVGTADNPYTGFLLNGSPYLLRGVCMHDDIVNKANALNDTDYDNTFATIQELGCNFIRLAHYPHPKEVYDRCDALGIVVQTEGPCVNKLQSTMPEQYYTHLTGQYTDMVNQHYNHPCIFFWGLSNETSTDDKAFGKQKVEEYTALIKNLDSERMVGYVLAQGNGTSPSAYYNDPSNVDWFGCNIYVGWYDSPNSNNPSGQITTRLANTIGRVGKPMAYSEYGCGGTPTCHSDDFMNTTTRGNNPRHDIEYMMWLHEGHIATIKQYPQLLYTSQWQLFDIAVASRNEGYTECLDGINTSTNDALRRLNNKGLVERDHVTKKDPFYLYKAWWNTTDTFVHICGKNYTKYENRTIKCYTNETGSLTMYVNGTSAETVTVTDNIATFTARNFYGTNTIMVSGATASDTFTLYGGTDPSLDYVDLGLPSGTLWAKMNVGAESETDYGNYYQYGKGADEYSVTSGDSRYEGTEKPLASSADTATQVWGGQWHMPTDIQFEELSGNTTFSWETDFNGSGINGAKFTAKNGSGNYIFLPASGQYFGGNKSYVNAHGSYWTSICLNEYDAWDYYIYTGGIYWSDNDKGYGFSVRPVKKPYDAEIEYLENSGTTYIDTGIIPDSDTGIYVKTSSGYSSLYQTEDVFIVGLRNNGSDTRWIVGHNERGFYYGYGVYDSTSYVATNADSECKLNYLNNKKWIVNDVEKTTLPSTLSFVPAYNIRLFGSAGYSAQTAYYRSCKAKIYFVKISQGSNVIMDLIPVRKNGVGYMYDKISGTLYGKSGDGELILGPDKT